MNYSMQITYVFIFCLVYVLKHYLYTKMVYKKTKQGFITNTFCGHIQKGVISIRLQSRDYSRYSYHFTNSIPKINKGKHEKCIRVQPKS